MDQPAGESLICTTCGCKAEAEAGALAPQLLDMFADTHGAHDTRREGGEQ